jgi:uncharacterized phage-associated protein
MSLSREAMKNHEIYERLNEEGKAAIDEALDGVRAKFHEYGIPTSNTDACEELVSAILAYALYSIEERNEVSKLRNPLTDMFTLAAAGHDMTEVE